MSAACSAVVAHGQDAETVNKEILVSLAVVVGEMVLWPEDLKDVLRLFAIVGRLHSNVYVSKTNERTVC